MSIVLDEYKWAEQAIENGELGTKPFETLSRVAKYYFENKHSKHEVRELLDSFLEQCSPSISFAHWSDTLDKIVKNVGKYPIIRLEGVDVSEKELARIETLGKKQIRRLAFTLLCVAKYWNAVSKSNGDWVNSPDKEIMQMANIKTSIKRQSLLFAELKEAGLISFSKKVDNLNVKVLFIEPGTTALHIRDFRNLGYQYLKYYGGSYFDCENCGLTVKVLEPSKGRHQRYCPVCAVKLHTKQKVNSVMRHRGIIKTSAVDKNDSAKPLGDNVFAGV